MHQKQSSNHLMSQTGVLGYKHFSSPHPKNAWAPHVQQLSSRKHYTEHSKTQQPASRSGWASSPTSNSSRGSSTKSSCRTEMWAKPSTSAPTSIATKSPAFHFGADRPASKSAPKTLVRSNMPSSLKARTIPFLISMSFHWISACQGNDHVRAAQLARAHFYISQPLSMSELSGSFCPKNRSCTGVRANASLATAVVLRPMIGDINTQSRMLNCSCGMISNENSEPYGKLITCIKRRSSQLHSYARPPYGLRKALPTSRSEWSNPHGRWANDVAGFEFRKTRSLGFPAAARFPGNDVCPRMTAAQIFAIWSLHAFDEYKLPCNNQLLLLRPSGKRCV